MSLELETPLVLVALLVAAPLLWLWPRPLRDPVHGLLRTLVVAFLLLALAGPIAIGTDGVKHVVVVLDESASVASADRARAATAARALLERSPGRRVLIAVGGRPGATLVSDAELGVRVANVGASRAESPVGDALLAAAGAIPEGSSGSITLLSDGLSTDDWAVALETLGARGIPLHTARLEAADGPPRAVSATLREPVRVGGTARLGVVLCGSRTDVDVVLRGPDGELARRAGVRCDGRTEIELSFEPSAPGFLPVTVEVAPRPGDGASPAESGAGDDPPPTRLRTLLAVQDPWRVVTLCGRIAGAEEQWRRLLGRGFDLQAGRDTSAVDLAACDLILIDDRPLADLPPELVRRLPEAIARDGLGLLLAGGEGAFGPGGYHASPLDEVLPVEAVQREEKKDPSTSLAIIIDTSGSMIGNRIRLAKAVARLAIRRLLPHDKVGIVEFYGNKRWAAPLQSAANSIEIQRALNRLDAGGGTILLPAIEEAYYGLRNVDTRYKHVLVLTDAGVESGSYEQLLRRMARDGIRTSTVLVGPGRHSEFLVQLADWGGGRYYNANDRFNLPEVILKQPSSARLPAYRRRERAVEALGGAGWWGEGARPEVPPVRGHVETRERPGAEVVLRTLPDGHPILASWRWGLGRVTALTTEATGPGTEGWREWEEYGRWMARVLQRTARDSRLPYRFRVARRRHTLSIWAERRWPTKSLPVAYWRDAAGEGRQSIPFVERADGVYLARFELPVEAAARISCGTDDARSGLFRLAVPSAVSARVEGERGDLAVDPVTALDLEAAALTTGGRSVTLDGLDNFTPAAGAPRESRAVTDLWPGMLALALLAYLGDIAYRRSASGRRREEAAT